MPKFLDASQWYTSNRTLINMGTPGTAVAGKYFGTISRFILSPKSSPRQRRISSAKERKELGS